MTSFGEPIMSMASYVLQSGRTQSKKPIAQDTTDARRETVDERKENEAKYKQNIDKLNRSSDTEIERALSGRDRGE
jgi:hypothetical protein